MNYLIISTFSLFLLCNIPAYFEFVTLFYSCIDITPIVLFIALFSPFGNKFNKQLPAYIDIKINMSLKSTTLVATHTADIQLPCGDFTIFPQSQVHIRLLWLSYIIYALVKKRHKVTILIEFSSNCLKSAAVLNLAT